MRNGRNASDCLLRAGLIWLIVMGTIGCILSATGTASYMPAICLIVALAALYCSFMYYRKLYGNIGYLLLFVIVVITALGLRTYINSGFYAVINNLAHAASDYFHTDAIRTYDSQVANIRLAVTVSMGFVGGCACILANILLSGRVDYALLGTISLAVMAYPLYLGLNPHPMWTAVLISGYVLAALRKRTRNSDWTKCHLYVAIGIITVAVAAAWVCAALPKRAETNLKRGTRDTVQNMATLGVMGLFDWTDNIGGLESGRLGNVNSVRPDFETDVEVTFTPYTYERMYLKRFVGAQYIPYDNRWQTTAALPTVPGDPAGPTGRMIVHNIDAGTVPLVPYYSDDAKYLAAEESREYNYCVNAAIGEAYDADGSPHRGDSDNAADEYLEIPVETQEAINQIIEEAGLTGLTAYDAAVALKSYYQDNMPYTLRPGRTPYRQDFVNYFLQKNRRGYCSHYASAATLIMRQLGYPARYIEGYCIDASRVFDGELREDLEYDDFYTGENALNETAVVTVAIPDAAAHAWVEVWDGRRWLIADVTPYSMEQEDDEGLSLWDRLIELLSGRSSGNATGEETTDNAENSEALRTASRIIASILGVVAGAAALAVLIYGCVRVIRYMRLNNSDRLVAWYRHRIRRISWRYPEACGHPDYEGQLRALDNLGIIEYDPEITAILDEAAFSGREISVDEFKKVVDYWRRI